MREFSKVSPKLWRSTRFRRLPIEQRLVYVYLLTSEHQTGAGCFRLLDGYAATDLGMEQGEFVAARDALKDADFIAYDPGTAEYFVPKWFRHNPPMNPKHLKGVESRILNLESDQVREAAEDDLGECERYRDAKAAGDNVPDSPPSSTISHLTSTRYMSRRAG